MSRPQQSSSQHAGIIGHASLGCAEAGLKTNTPNDNVRKIADDPFPVKGLKELVILKYSIVSLSLINKIIVLFLSLIHI